MQPDCDLEVVLDDGVLGLSQLFCLWVLLRVNSFLAIGGDMPLSLSLCTTHGPL